MQRYGTDPVLAYALLGLVIWTALAAFSYWWNTGQLEAQTIELARSEARSNWNKDAAFRRWAARHGGFYVKPDARTPPNPFLSHLPNRDVVTTDGTRLTLMNPAYMMRQMTAEFEEMYGVKGKITGKVLLNPNNKPDDWELRTLDRFINERLGEVIEVTDIDDEPYLRLMKPMYMTEGCDKCHGHLGFDDGDLRGGVSVSIPLRRYLNAAGDTGTAIAITHASVWLLGAISIVAFGGYVSHRQRERAMILGELQHQAMYDSLTGLPNRGLFLDRLAQAIQRVQRDPERLFAVCFLDLDGFKQVNDNHGHSTGDLLLKSIAKRLDQCVRPGDTVARQSGDEFLILLEHCQPPSDAESVCARLLRELGKPFALSGRFVQAAASIGICEWNGSYGHAEEMIRDADIAMYRAKLSGNNQLATFEPQMGDQLQHLGKVELGLASALQNGELEVFYQPVVNIVTQTVSGFEALLRWRHPELGLVAPDEFIPVAERTGHIVGIGAWVIDEACARMQAWNSRYCTSRAPLQLSINLSPRQAIEPGIAQTLADALADTQLPANLLHLEFTETMLVTNQQLVQQHLLEIRELGIRLSADDFGTGYSSLNYLQQYQFDSLKIDKLFTQDIEKQGRGAKLVDTIISLARALDMLVIAEGVENKNQVDYLRSRGCAWVQGYYYCPPLPASQMEALLDTGAADRAELLRMDQPIAGALVS